MNIKVVLYSGLIVIAATVIGCDAEPKLGSVPDIKVEETTEPEAPTKGVYAPIEMSRAEAEMMDKQNAFAIEFYNKAVADMPGENVVLSPLSMATYLSLLANGAAGDTQAEILAALGFEASELDALNALNARIAAGIASVDSDVATNLANSIWIDRSFKVKESFLNDMRSKYNADIFNEQLYSATTMQKINAWGDEQTRGLIPALLSKPLAQGTKMTMLNATYFNGGWNMPFDKDLTEKSIFHNADGTTAMVEMMFRSADITCFHDKGGATWVKLSFGNMTFFIDLILPDEGMEIGQYMTSLTGDDLKQVLAIREPLTIKLRLPKFTIESDANTLREALESMGVKKIFGKDADFSNIADGGLALDDIVQKTKIELDEEGAKAAGITQDLWLTIDIDGVIKSTDVIFDRPFAFIISEKSTNAILFIGRICKL